MKLRGTLYPATIHTRVHLTRENSIEITQDAVLSNVDMRYAICSSKSIRLNVTFYGKICSCADGTSALNQPSYNFEMWSNAQQYPFL
jgi:hypothetical protein